MAGMRALVLLLLIALLPWRAWAHDNAATHAASAPQVASTSADPHAHCHTHTVAHDTTHTPAPTAHASTDCDSCAQCHMCFSLALPTAWAAPSLPPTHHAPPTAQEERFRSAALSLGHKPPIS